jgi:hypothetical protein
MNREPGTYRLDYLSYLIRLWRVGDEGNSTRRVSLQRPRSGEPIAFASLDATVAFLRAETGMGILRQGPESEEPEGGRSGVGRCS